MEPLSPYLTQSRWLPPVTHGPSNTTVAGVPATPAVLHSFGLWYSCITAQWLCPCLALAIPPPQWLPPQTYLGHGSLTNRLTEPDRAKLTAAHPDMAWDSLSEIIAGYGAKARYLPQMPWAYACTKFRGQWMRWLSPRR